MTRLPYVILKFAQTTDGYLGHPNKQVWLTNPISKRLVHKWRSEIDAIMIGTQTALVDNPKLNNRLYFGGSPLRVVYDRQLRLPPTLSIFDDQVPTLIVTAQKRPDHGFTQTQYWNTVFDDQILRKTLDELGKRGFKSLMVEGGASLLNSFLDQKLWDEIRVFTAPQRLYDGVPAPSLSSPIYSKHQIGSDLLEIYRKSSS